MKWLVLISLVSVFTYAQHESPFNGRKPKLDSTGEYSFWVSGHFYGGSSNISGYPANTLLGNIDMINNSGTVMLMSCGDLFKDVKNDIPFYKQSFFNRLEIPLYNAVGNHDISGDVYQENFGATYFYFQIEKDIHIVLDSEIDDGDIQDSQLQLLRKVESQVSNDQIKNVFVYAHRTIWKDTYPELDNILNDNTQSLTGNNFESDVLPIVKNIAKNAKVFWFGGSLGNAPFSFLHFHPEENITYIATAIRAIPRDAMLKITSNKGQLSFETVSLTGQEMRPLQEYTVDQWETTSPEEPFNWRLVPLYIKQTVLSWRFFFGALTMLCASLLVGLIRKRKRRTKPLS